MKKKRKKLATFKWKNEMKKIKKNFFFLCVKEKQTNCFFFFIYKNQKLRQIIIQTNKKIKIKSS